MPYGRYENIPAGIPGLVGGSGIIGSPSVAGPLAALGPEAIAAMLEQQPAMNTPAQPREPQRFSQAEIDSMFASYSQANLDQIRSALNTGALPPGYDEQFVRNALLRRQQQLNRKSQ